MMMKKNRSEDKKNRSQGTCFCSCFVSDSFNNSMDSKNINGGVVSRSRSRKKKAQRILSRIVKAVLLETFLRKKSRNKKVRHDSLVSESNLSSKFREKKLSKEEEMMIDAPISSSTRSSLSVSSNSSYPFSSSSSMNSTTRFSSDTKKSFRSNSFEIKPNTILMIEDDSTAKERKVGKIIRSYNSMNGLFLLVMVLLILMFWGRICAIVCTSMWVYFVPGLRLIEDEDISEEKEIESKEYKKRVILEGLMEKNHGRV